MSPTPSPGMRFANPTASRTAVAERLPDRQRGAALLIFLGVLVLLAATILVSRLNAAVVPTPYRDPGTAQALANAKLALIAWAATHPDTPGLLPFPDRNDDATPNYDGTSDCIAPGAVVPTDLIGSFPILGEESVTGCASDVPMSVESRDTSAQRLWYAVSQNLVRGGGGGLINPDIGELAVHPWLTVVDETGTVISNRVAAVIIAPGVPVAAQDRTGIAPAAANYLDSLVVGGTTYDNADFDGCPDALVPPCAATPGEEFIVKPRPADGDNFNDRLVYITVDELMSAVEERVLGEAARALKNYRTTGDVYPWMSPFSDPRAKLEGIATGGSATSLIDAGGVDFTAVVPAIVPGDIVRNLSDGSARTVATVTPTTLTLFSQGLLGGTSNTFIAGDRYVVHAAAKFDGVAGTVDGLLPISFPGKVFNTGFVVNWAFTGEDSSVTWDDGNPALVPTAADVQNFNGNNLTVLYPSGSCRWTQTDRVDCIGTRVLPNTPVAGTTRTVNVEFNFTADTTTVTPPTGATGRRRNVTFNGNYDGPVVALPGDFPQNTWSVRVTDFDGTNTAYRQAQRIVGTTLNITMNGIYYEDLDVPADLPQWFVDNLWNHFVYGAASGANLPTTGSTSGDGTCTSPPAGNTMDGCLTLQFNGATVNQNVAAVVIGPGMLLPAQNRNIASSACAGHPLALFCDYFEGPNSDDESPNRNMVFGRTPADSFSIASTFNDHMRSVPP